MSLVVSKQRWRMRGGTAANLATVDEVPLVRELQIETDTRKMKLGDGTTAWSLLPYIGTDSIPEQSNLYFTDGRVYDALKAQLVAGSNVTITPDDGDVKITIAATAGGGSADPSANLVDPMHDFLGKPPTNILEEAGASYPWVAGSIGPGGSISSVNGGADAPGVWRLNCGTTASGVTYISLGAVPNITLGAGVVRIPFRFRAPTLSTGTDRFQYNIGLRQSWGAAPAERIVLRYDHSLNSGKIDLLVTVGGVTTTVNGSTTVAANTWVSGYFEISADGSEVDLYVNGALEASANSGLPTGAMAVGAQINKVAGTSSRDLDLDYLGPVQIEFTTPR